MGIAVLGPLRVDGVPGVLGSRDRVVLAALALRPGEVVSRPTLAEALWGEQPPASASKVVQGCVVRLRKALGPSAIETTPGGYRLDVPPDDVDAPRFERLVRSGSELLPGDPVRAAQVIGEGLELWRGPPFVDLERWERGRVEAARLEEVRLDAEEARLDAALQAGRHREVLAEALARVSEAPGRERRWALLALAQYRTGRREEALRTLRRARTTLEAERIGKAGPELTTLEQAVRRQDPSLTWQAPEREPSPLCPYPGLVPYDVDDGDLFFGREAAVGACLERLATEGVLVVVGPAGSGTSSLARAGVAATLRRQGHRVVVVTPGTQAVDALTAVPSSGAPPVLVVDDCEEAVVLWPHDQEREPFLAALAALAERGPLVVALRADQLGALSSAPAFAELVGRGLQLVPPLRNGDLRAAIEGPAHQAGLQLEAGLVDLLVGEAEGKPDALPRLSHALRETWLRRVDGTLTVAGYRDGGGIEGSVARTAEAVYADLTPPQQTALRDVLRQLPAPRSAVAVDDDHERVIDLLVEARLVTTDDEVIALAHESLVRAWPRLGHWVKADVDTPPPVGEHAGPDDARTSRRLTPLLAGTAVLLAVALVGGLLATRRADRADSAAVAADARRLAAQAQATGDIDEALLQAVEAVHLDDSPDIRARLLDVLGRTRQLIGSGRAEDTLFGLDVSPDGRIAAVADATNRVWLHDAATGRSVGRFDGPDPGRAGGVSPNALAFSPDSRVLAVGRWAIDPVPVRLLDLATLTEADVQVGGLPTAPSRVTDLTYSGDGRFLAVTFEHHEDEAPDQASLPTSASAFVWALDAPEQPVARIPVPPSTRAVELSPDGARLYAGTWPSPSITSYDVATGQPVRSMDVPSFPLVLSPDGTLLAAPSVAPRIPPLAPDQSAGTDIVLLDALTGEERGRLRGHTAQVNDVQFSPDGLLLASASSDDTAVVWDLTTGQRRDELRGHSGDVNGVGFSPDGATLYTSGSDRALLLWDLRGDRRFLPRVTLAAPVAIDTPGFVGFVSVNPVAPAVAYVWTQFDGAGVLHSLLQFLDLNTGRAGGVIDAGHGAIRSTSWHPDGRALATAGLDGAVRVWDWRRGALAAERQVASGVVTGLDYTADGARLLVGELGGGTYVIDAGTLEPLSRPTRVEDGILGAYTSPDGNSSIALTGAPDAAAPTDPLARIEGYALVDVAGRRVRHRDRLGFTGASAEFSPDGRRIAIAGSEGELLLLDADTGEPVGPAVTGGARGALDVAYAPDGATIVTGGLDAVSLWDGATGALLGTVRPGSPSSGAFGEVHPDGHTVLIASWDGAIHTWDTTSSHWIDFACDVAGRNLTEEEWRSAVGDRPPRATCPNAS